MSRLSPLLVALLTACASVALGALLNPDQGREPAVRPTPSVPPPTTSGDLRIVPAPTVPPADPPIGDWVALRSNALLRGPSGDRPAPGIPSLFLVVRTAKTTAGGPWYWVVGEQAAGRVATGEIMTDGEAIPAIRGAIQAVNEQLYRPTNNASSALLFRQRGLLELGLKQPDIAISDFTESLRLDPKDPFGYYYRGVAFHKMATFTPTFNEVDERLAYGDLTESLRLEPRFVAAHLARATVISTWKDKGSAPLVWDETRALEEYNSILRLDPWYPPAVAARKEIFDQTVNEALGVGLEASGATVPTSPALSQPANTIEAPGVNPEPLPRLPETDPTTRRASVTGVVAEAAPLASIVPPTSAEVSLSIAISQTAIAEANARTEEARARAEKARYEAAQYRRARLYPPKPADPTPTKATPTKATPTKKAAPAPGSNTTTTTTKTVTTVVPTPAKADPGTATKTQ